MEAFMNPAKLSAGLLLFAAVLFVTCPLFSQAPEGDPKLTEVWEPVPPVVTPGIGTAPPSDAVVLFSGVDFSQWQSAKGDSVRWKLEDGAMTVVRKTGNISTRRGFGDCQLHIEWRTPAKVEGESQGRGNSGIFLQSRYELQVLDSYENRTYSNGQAGSMYKQAIPLVNACRKPGEWQAYDVVYSAPRFAGDGAVQKPAFITVFQNGVLVLNHFELKGPTEYIGQPKYKKHGEKEPLMLQDHGNPVSYRNIWIREL
jgi:hypothetical protein